MPADLTLEHRRWPIRVGPSADLIPDWDRAPSASFGGGSSASLSNGSLASAVSSGVLFPGMGNGLIQETSAPSAIVARVLGRLGAVIVSPWRYGWEDLPSGRFIEGMLNVTPPTGEIARFHVFVASSSRGPLRELVWSAKHAAAQTGMPAVVFSEFANPALRQACQELEVGFADETGWVSLRHDAEPAMLLKAQGAARSSTPARDGTMSNLGGPGAGKIVRALWRLTGYPMGVRQIAEDAKVSPGTVSKVLPTLALHGAVERDDAGRVIAVSHRLLLDRWTQDYQFTKSNRTVTWYLAPRGLLEAQNRIVRLPVGTLIRSTGPLAARQSLSGDLLAVTPLTLLAYYTDHPAYVAERCGFAQVDQPATANVVLAQPQDINDEELLNPFGGPPANVLAVVPAQILADLMTMGGRYPEQAEQLFTHLYPAEAGVK